MPLIRDSHAPPARCMCVNACLMICWLFIHFLVRLAFRPSGGAPNEPQLATTIASSSTTPAPFELDARAAWLIEYERGAL